MPDASKEGLEFLAGNPEYIESEGHIRFFGACEKAAGKIKYLACCAYIFFRGEVEDFLEAYELRKK